MKISLEKSFEAIESDTFSAKVGVASSFPTLIDGLTEEPAVTALLETSTPEELEAIFARLLLLSQREIDSRYLNPWDFAITTYLWILWQKDMQVAQVAAAIIASVRNLWWGMYLAHHILHSSVSETDVDLGR